MRRLEDFLDADSTGRRRVRFIVALLTFSAFCLLWAPAAAKAWQDAWYEPLSQRQVDDCEVNPFDAALGGNDRSVAAPCPYPWAYSGSHRDARTLNDQRRAAAASAVGNDLRRPLRPTFITVVIATALWFAFPKHRGSSKATS